VCWIVLTLCGATRSLYRMFFKNLSQVVGVEDNMSDWSQTGLLWACGNRSGSTEDTEDCESAGSASGLWGVPPGAGASAGVSNPIIRGMVSGVGVGGDDVSVMSISSIDNVLNPPHPDDLIHL